MFSFDFFRLGKYLNEMSLFLLLNNRFRALLKCHWSIYYIHPKILNIAESCEKINSKASEKSVFNFNIQLYISKDYINYKAKSVYYVHPSAT